MESLGFALTAVHLLAAVAWLGGMIFHIVVLDPVFRKNDVSFQSAFLLALMERRFRKLVGTSIVLLAGSGAAKAYLLLGSLPAFLLLFWFAMTSLMALRRLRMSAWLFALGFVASAAIFTYDAVARNYQLHAENYHATGHQKTFHYATWWCYDESWFRS